MALFYSASIGGFLDDAIHATIPADAVKITVAAHAKLLAAQSAGKRIAADKKGRPVAIAPPATPLDDRRARAIAAVKREAGRRIEAIAPVWRQLNALRAGAELAEFTAIDAVRAASNAIEAAIARMPAKELAALDIANDDRWPDLEEAA